MTSGLFECGLRLHGLPYRRGLETNFAKFLNFGWRLKWLFMNTFYKILVVWVFGGLGAVTRYGVLLFMDARGLATGNWLGLPTLVFNVTACFIIGFLAGLIYTHAEWSDTLKGALSLSAMTGFCGGFSSFSSYTLDSLHYFEDGKLNVWVVFGVLTVFLSLFVCALGYWIGKKL